MSGVQAQELPIFELPIVLLPGEQLPLHIFEDRYKRMIGRALERGEPFGVVLRDDDGARAIGCTATVEEVLEQFDDGRMNVVVSGGEPFRVLDRFESPEYPLGEVEVVDDEAPDADENTAMAARDAFAEIAERATGSRPSEDELAGTSAYAIASRIELPHETKQRLLELRDEEERMGLLADALQAVEEALDRAELTADHARSNGRVFFE